LHVELGVLPCGENTKGGARSSGTMRGGAVPAYALIVGDSAGTTLRTFGVLRQFNCKGTSVEIGRVGAGHYHAWIPGISTPTI
jgi:hypothetical protein